MTVHQGLARHVSVRYSKFLGARPYLRPPLGDGLRPRRSSNLHENLPNPTTAKTVLPPRKKVLFLPNRVRPFLIRTYPCHPWFEFGMRGAHSLCSVNPSAAKWCERSGQSWRRLVTLLFSQSSRTRNHSWPSSAPNPRFIVSFNRCHPKKSKSALSSAFLAFSRTLCSATSCRD